MDFEILDILTPLGFTLRVLLAIALGFIIGLERQWTRHEAGIVTNVIVCVASFGYTAFSYLVDPDANDLTRIAANVVTGIGFLGTGVILRDGANIRGLTTAATVWASGAVGLLCCVDDISFAIILAAFVVIAHLLLHPLSVYIRKKRKHSRSQHRSHETVLQKTRSKLRLNGPEKREYDDDDDDEDEEEHDTAPV